MTINRFTVFGQRCSGTNALIKLIEANFPSLPFCEQSGFKHWLVPEDRELPDDLLVIVIAREVQSWLRSLHRNPWHVVAEMRDLSFSEFIRAEWRTVWDMDFWGIDEKHPLFAKPIVEERCPVSGNPFKNAVAMRTAKLRNWLALEQRCRKLVTLTQHELAANAEGVVSRIARSSGHEACAHFVPVITYKGQGAKPYVAKKLLSVSKGDWAHLRRYLDQTIEHRFGFQLAVHEAGQPAT